MRIRLSHIPDPTNKSTTLVGSRLNLDYHTAILHTKFTSHLLNYIHRDHSQAATSGNITRTENLTFWGRSCVLPV